MAGYVTAACRSSSLTKYMRVVLDLFYDKRYSHTKMKNPDFILLAESMGVHAIRCHTAEELPAKMKEFLEYDGSRPVLMECLVEKNEHVFPMVRNQFDSRLFLDAHQLLRRSPLGRLSTSRCCTPRWRVPLSG